MVGGSDGHEDLNSIEYYDMAKRKWSKIKFDFDIGCTNLGAIACDKYIYLVGLKNQATKSLSRSSCLKYEQATNTFHRIAELNSGRSQSALVLFTPPAPASVGGTGGTGGNNNNNNNMLFVFGGYDQIKCLNSCEVYNVRENTWTILASMYEPRRGCGAAVHRATQQIWVVGGTNGAQSLRSVEIYDVRTKRWTLGPELNVARTNVAIEFIGKTIYL